MRKPRPPWDHRFHVEGLTNYTDAHQYYKVSPSYALYFAIEILRQTTQDDPIQSLPPAEPRKLPREANQIRGQLFTRILWERCFKWGGVKKHSWTTEVYVWRSQDQCEAHSNSTIGNAKQSHTYKLGEQLLQGPACGTCPAKHLWWSRCICMGLSSEASI